VQELRIGPAPVSSQEQRERCTGRKLGRGTETTELVVELLAQLGDGSGEDVVKRIRTLNPKAFVVETSGSDVDGVLEKPFDLRALVNSVLEAVRKI